MADSSTPVGMLLPEDNCMAVAGCSVDAKVTGICPELGCICAEGYTYNEVTGMCDPDNVCPVGYVYNEVTGYCDPIVV